MSLTIVLYSLISFCAIGMGEIFAVWASTEIHLREFCVKYIENQVGLYYHMWLYGTKSNNQVYPYSLVARASNNVTTSHLLTLKALPRQLVALETANLQSLRSRMLPSVSPFLLMSLLMVSMYRNFGLPLGLTPSTTMTSTVLVVWLSSLRLTRSTADMSIPA